jgi:hypothetical protein
MDVTRAWTRVDRVIFACRSRGSLAVSATISGLARTESKHQSIVDADDLGAVAIAELR